MALKLTKPDTDKENMLKAGENFPQKELWRSKSLAEVELVEINVKEPHEAVTEQ